MNKKINLQSIRKYNPGLLKDEDVINNFLVRQKVFHTLINQIRKEEKDSIPQHNLIIGQRGMGKTTLLKRIEVELRSDALLADKFVPLQFPEELYNIDRLSKFWLNTIDVLIDYLEIVNEKSLSQKCEKQVKKLLNDGDQSYLDENAYTLFMSMMAELDKRPVLLVDNLDLVFERLQSDEQWQLREKMSKSNAPIFIGASAAPFDAVFDYKQAFYDYFKLTTLDPLEYEFFLELIISLADSLDDEKIKSSFYTNQNRIKTLFRLTGGNIRTAIILFSSLSAGFGTNVSDDLEKLLDEVTPIYKARVDELSDQMRTIVDAIALYWDPIDLQKLRDITLLENNTLSPQLRRLRQIGWITKAPSNKTKGDKYEMTERFFNVWYLMRRSTRRHRKNITCLSRFIEEFYGEELHQIATSLLSKSIASENDAVFRLALSPTIKNKTLKEKFDAHTSDGINILAESEPEIYGKLGIENKIELNFDEYDKLIKNEKYREADEWLSNMIELFPKNAKLRFYKGYVNQEYLKNFDKALISYHYTIKLDSKLSEPWENLGNLYQDNLNEFDKAKEAYFYANELNPNNASIWYNLGNLLMKHFKEYDKAKDAYLKAIELDPEYLSAMTNLGYLYHYHLKEFNKAKEYYLCVIAIKPNFAYAWINLGNLYQEYFNNYENAKHAYEKAIKSDPDDGYSWNNLGNLYHLHLKDYKKAEHAYKMAIKLASELVYPLNNLGNLYSNQINEYDKAKDTYLKAIALDPNYSNAWNGLGNLYHDNLKEYEKAKDAYFKAILSDPTNIAAIYNLIFLLRDILGQRDEALNKFKAVEIEKEKEMMDTYFLHQSLFHIYDFNFGLASESLKHAIEKLEDKNPLNTFDDWVRYASVAIRKGFGSEMLSVFQEFNIDVIMRPYYEACVALQNKDKGHFQDVAMEVREIAKEIYDRLINYSVK